MTAVLRQITLRDVLLVLPTETYYARGMRVAIYARVSTLDQEPENQLQELRRYVEARGWAGVEFVDKGVSGAKD